MSDPTSSLNVFLVGFLGNNRHALRGKLGITDAFDALALPDTGAECNTIRRRYASILTSTTNNFVILLLDIKPTCQSYYTRSYAERLGMEIYSSSSDRSYIRFADGSGQETTGRVYSYWSFECDECDEWLVIRFEVLDVCSFDIFIGEEIIWGHEVFEKHASSIVSVSSEDEQSVLAPFDFFLPWQKKMSDIVNPETKRRTKHQKAAGSWTNLCHHHILIDPGEQSASVAHLNEMQRRDEYNLKTDFGKDARPIERELETQRRAVYSQRAQ